MTVAATPAATPFPEDFLWGTATASHQVEGGNTNNDVWLYEHVPNTMYAESSGDAYDHYNRYPSLLEHGVLRHTRQGPLFHHASGAG